LHVATDTAAPLHPLLTMLKTVSRPVN
jgi:hypothetical protein